MNHAYSLKYAGAESNGKMHKPLCALAICLLVLGIALALLPSFMTVPSSGALYGIASTALILGVGVFILAVYHSRVEKLIIDKAVELKLRPMQKRAQMGDQALNSGDIEII